MVFIFLFCVFFCIPSFSMEIAFEPCKPKVDWMPPFEPSERAAQYKILVGPQNKTNEACNLSLEKRYAFEDCMNLLRANHLALKTLNDILDDPDLMEAVIAYAPHYLRNGFIELFFAGSLQYGKVEAYNFFLKHHVYNTAIRLGPYEETPAEFIRRLN